MLNKIIIKQQGKKNALVTVAISLYNYQNYIIECLNSVKNQTLNCLDLVIVDDGSTDHSLILVQEWVKQNGFRFNNCLIIKHKSNLGIAETRNNAFFYTRTKYVFILDADNLIYPRCLERLSYALNECSADFSYCYLEQFGEVQKLINLKFWVPDNFRYGNSIDAMVLIRKSSWKMVNGYSKYPIQGLEDYDLWIKIALNKGWGILVPEILARYRVHKQSMLHTATNPNIEKLSFLIYNKYPNFFLNKEKENILKKIEETNIQIHSLNKRLSELESTLFFRTKVKFQKIKHYFYKQ